MKGDSIEKKCGLLIVGHVQKSLAGSVSFTVISLSYLHVIDCPSKTSLGTCAMCSTSKQHYIIPSNPAVIQPT